MEKVLACNQCFSVRQLF